MMVIIIKEGVTTTLNLNWNKKKSEVLEVYNFLCIDNGKENNIQILADKRILHYF